MPENALGLGAGNAARWIAFYEGDAERAFRECDRPEIALHVALLAGVDRKALVACAADAALLATRRVGEPDLRCVRAVASAHRWVRGDAGPAEAWAAAFAASDAATESGHTNAWMAAARACAAAGFACDAWADASYYAQRAHAAIALEQALRAFGAEESTGVEALMAIVRQHVTPSMVAAAAEAERIDLGLDLVPAVSRA